MPHRFRQAAILCSVLLGFASASASAATLTYAAAFESLSGAVFGQPSTYAFSTSFTVDSAADPVSVAMAGTGVGTPLYGYGADAVSGFAAVYGDQTFTQLTSVVVPGGAAAAVWFDAPLSSGKATRFMLRAADTAGTLSLGSLDCSPSCTFAAFALVQDHATNGIARATSAVPSVIAAPVPEPASWALMLAGLGAVGAAACRSRRG